MVSINQEMHRINNCSLFSKGTDTTYAGAHVQLRILAHAVGVSDVAATITGIFILETFQHGALFFRNAGKLFEALHQTESGFAARMGL